MPVAFAKRLSAVLLLMVAAVLGGRRTVIGAALGATFLIVAGLLNMLVVIDAYDVRLGRK